MTFNSFVSVLFSLCHGYKGIWDAKIFFLSLPLCGCVCYTCVSIPAFKSMICFIFFLSFTVGKVSVLYTLLAVSPASAPLPSPQQSLISIWGSGVPGMLILLPPPDLVTICWKAFDCSSSYSEQKNPKCFHRAAKLDAVQPCYANLISYSLPTHSVLLYTDPLAFP